MEDAIAVLTSPLFQLLDLALESPLAAGVVLCLLGVLVFAIVV
jgi:hypothetical protein